MVGISTKNHKKLFIQFSSSFFFKADTIIVLSNNLKDQLQNLGYTKPIAVEITPVDKNLVSSFTIADRLERIETLYQNYLSKDFAPNILFLSRIEIDKGIYEAALGFKSILEKFPNAKLLIAGDGTELDKFSKYVLNEKIHNIKFLGYVYGLKKIEVFKSQMFLYYQAIQKDCRFPSWRQLLLVYL